MKPLNAIRMAGREILPLIEGGKGISVTNGRSAGAWAFAGFWRASWRAPRA